MISFNRLNKLTFNINKDQILYFKAEGKLSIIAFKKGDQLGRNYINHLLCDIEKQLQNDQDFFRLHKSFIINLKKINCSNDIKTSTIVIQGQHIPIARRRANKFKEAFAKISK